jgi:DNA-binding response OmpR family regulator
MRILLVEDDKHLGRATKKGLKTLFAVDWVTSAEEAESAIATINYELFIFDINLPGKSGLSLMEELRREKILTPILLLTARDAVEYRVAGLNAGADDYLVKPFDLDELLARCSALLRRGCVAENIICHKNLKYEPATAYLLLDDKSIQLSQRENAIFACLIRNIGRPVSKSKIEESIYDWSSEHIESNTVEVHIAALRRKLGRDVITTLRGIGYSIQ